MDRFFRFIIRHRKAVIVCFIVLAGISAAIAGLVTVNYDMLDYLPRDAQSTKAISIIEQEFREDTPNTRVMLTDVTVREALEYKKSIEAVEGVKSVIWLDDAVGIDVLSITPTEFLDEAVLNSYYKNGNALLSVSIESGRESKAIRDIRNLTGDKGAVAGNAANAATMQELAVTEVVNAMAILIPIVLVILTLATTSWLEPLLFVCSIGIAVLINMGTSAFFGEYSFVTQTVAPVLQLAVSLDYAIFLLHSFSDYLADHQPEEAMLLATRKSLSTVAASAATTVIGFAALLFMRFGIGADLGIHLAKGIVLSFLSVMIFLPALTLACLKLLDRTRHKSLVPSFDGVGKVLMKARIPFLVLALIVAVPCFLAQSHTGFMYGMGGVAKSTQAGQDAARIEEVFGKENALVLLVPRESSGKESALCDELSSLPYVTGVVSYSTAVGAEIPPEFVSEDVFDRFYSEHYARIVLYADTAEEGDEAFETVQSVLSTAHRYYDDCYLTGQSASLFDMKNVVEKDTKVVNLVAVIGIFLVILLTFRSISVPFLLVFVIETAIWINLSVAYFTDNTLSFIGYLIISTVQLGATVDYAILLTNNYLANRKELPKKQAMLSTLSANLPAVLLSACILSIAGFTLSFTSSNPIVSELGILLGRGTILSFVMVVCVLPALLVLFDRIIEKTTLKNGLPVNPSKSM